MSSLLSAVVAAVAALAALPAAVSATAVAAQPGAFPYIVAINANGTQYCEGVLINAETVLTAAHCSEKFLTPDFSWFSIRAGSLNWNSEGVETGVDRFVVHPDFDWNSGNNDVGLWHLSTPIQESSTVSYVTLPQQGSDGPVAGSNVVVAGWSDYTLESSTTYLRQITLPVVSHEACEAEYYDNYEIPVTDSMFCAGVDAGGRTDCTGVSGSPVVAEESRTLLGLVSMAMPDCRETKHYDIYTRVNKFVDWINANKF